MPHLGDMQADEPVKVFSDQKMYQALKAMECGVECGVVWKVARWLLCIWLTCAWPGL